MQMTKKLYQLVVEEANNIKKYATPEEIDLLTPEALLGGNMSRCIYGQMTGHCNSDRALELIRKCAAKVSTAYKGRWESPQKITSETRYGHSWGAIMEYFSPIELALFDLAAIDQQAIAKYIKGETDSLEFFYEKNYK